MTPENVATYYLRKVDADFLVRGHIPADKGFRYPNGQQVIVDCSASPSSYICFSTKERLTTAKLRAGVVVF